MSEEGVVADVDNACIGSIGADDGCGLVVNINGHDIINRVRVGGVCESGGELVIADTVRENGGEIESVGCGGGFGESINNVTFAVGDGDDTRTGDCDDEREIGGFGNVRIIERAVAARWILWSESYDFFTQRNC